MAVLQVLDVSKQDRSTVGSASDRLAEAALPLKCLQAGLLKPLTRNAQEYAPSYLTGYYRDLEWSLSEFELDDLLDEGPEPSLEKELEGCAGGA